MGRGGKKYRIYLIIMIHLQRDILMDVTKGVLMKKDIKILMVDDEQDFTQPMSFWFKSKGF